MKLLMTTHSSRWFDSKRASLNGLNERFEKRSLDDLPELHSFQTVGETIQLSGRVAFWEVERRGKDVKARLLKVLEPEANPQSPCFVGDNLAIASSDRIMKLDTDFRGLAPLSDNWIAGTHTVRDAGDGSVWVTSAPGNAALRVDFETGAVVERLIMPDVYGTGYVLSENDDLRQNFIPLDYQPTHINSAVPTADGELLVTLLVPGAVGVFDKERNYREIVSGLRGCHGGRRHPDTGELYVSDSPGGMVWYFDYETGKPTRRMDFESRWLHDAIAFGDGVIVGLASDKNNIVFMDERSSEILEKISCDLLGRSTLFAHLDTPSDAWQAALLSDGGKIDEKNKKWLDQRGSLTKYLELTDIISDADFLDSNIEKKNSFELFSGADVIYDYLLKSQPFFLPSGTSRLSSEAVCHQGAITIGLIDTATQAWMVQNQHDARRKVDWVDFRCEQETEAVLVVAAFNSDGASPVRARINRVDVLREDRCAEETSAAAETEKPIPDLMGT